jgi:phytoene synthase
MPTMAALEAHIGDTSSTLFALAGRILTGEQPEAIDHLAHHAGLALGIAGVIAALPLDASRRQLFVPLELLEQHGSGMEEAFAGKAMPKLRTALDQLIGEARAHARTALTLLPGIPPDARPAFLPLALAERDLARMARADANPFVPHVTSRLRVLWTLWRASRSKAFG